MTEIKQRGGSGRGQGRKPVKTGEETVTVSLRVTAAQREKLARLGGAEWVRGKIDRARESNAVLGRANALEAELKATQARLDASDELLREEFAQRQDALATLRDIGDFAHDRSTGPAVEDALWEVRRMAYEALTPN